MNQVGWIKLHRTLINWEWYGSPKHVAVFIDLLLSTNHKENKYRGTVIKRGQLTTSYRAIAERSGVSYQSVRTVLADLVATGEITYQNIKKCSMITMLKWDSYQLDNIETNTHINRQLTGNQHTTNRQLTTNKNDNNEKNDNNSFYENASKDFSNELLDKVKQAWNEICPGNGLLSHDRGTKPKTIKEFVSLVSANKELKNINTWIECFNAVKESTFLNGQNNNSNFVCTLDWLISSHKIVDVLNGQYGGKNEGKVSVDEITRMISQGRSA